MNDKLYVGFLFCFIVVCFLIDTSGMLSLRKKTKGNEITAYLAQCTMQPHIHIRIPVLSLVMY